MYLFPSDETNTTQSDTAQFLIFGAMVISMENAPAAVKEVLGNSPMLRLSPGFGV